MGGSLGRCMPERGMPHTPVLPLAPRRSVTTTLPQDAMATAAPDVIHASIADVDLHQIRTLKRKW